MRFGAGWVIPLFGSVGVYNVLGGPCMGNMLFVKALGRMHKRVPNKRGVNRNTETHRNRGRDSVLVYIFQCTHLLSTFIYWEYNAYE